MISKAFHLIALQKTENTTRNSCTQMVNNTGEISGRASCLKWCNRPVNFIYPTWWPPSPVPLLTLRLEHSPHPESGTTGCSWWLHSAVFSAHLSLGRPSVSKMKWENSNINCMHTCKQSHFALLQLCFFVYRGNFFAWSTCN